VSELVTAVGEPRTTSRMEATATAAGCAFAVFADLGSGGRRLAPVAMESASVIELPPEMPAQAALLVPHVAEALRAWEMVGLELGSAAIVTRAAPWSALLAAVATWYGAVPLVVGNGSNDDAIGSTDVDGVGRLRETLAGFARVGAVEVSGRADAVDLLLEAIPRYAGVLFAGPRVERFTIDYYVNVHRKSIILSATILDPMRIFSGCAADGGRAARAVRLLTDPRRAAAVRALVDWQPTNGA
jgi:hypothetical protein